MVVTKVPQHMWVHSGHSDPGAVSEVVQAAARGVTVHPSSGAVERDRPGYPVSDGSLDRPHYRRRERDEHDPAALADNSQDAVAVFLAEVGDVRPAGLEDP
jgi:hypothetical protein